MSPEQQRGYEVGYRKPPRHTRFKKGQSGNPKGRPAGAKNLSTLLNEALNECVIVTENGGHRKITKREAIIKQLVQPVGHSRLARDQDPARHASRYRKPNGIGNSGSPLFLRGG
jgi:hypothetical protein